MWTVKIMVPAGKLILFSRIQIKVLINCNFNFVFFSFFSYHTIECGAGVGIYLRTNDCKIMLLAGKSKGKIAFSRLCIIT